MALLFCDGFDHYDTSHLMEKWDTANGGPSISSPGRNTASTYNNFASLGYGAKLGKAVPNSSTLTVGFALNPNTFSGGNNMELLYFKDASQAQLIVSVLGSTQIQVKDGNNNVLGTTSAPYVPSNTFTYIEIKVVFATSATGSCNIQVNGSNVLSLTGITTAVTANAYANLVELHGSVDSSNSFDDLYICDATGTYNTTFLGDVRIALALPSATGRLSQWTRTGGTASGNYTAVNEVPPNDDTSYVSSSTVGNIDAYGISSIGTPTAIVAVQLVSCARKTDSASRSIGLGFGNTTTDNFDTGHSVTNSYMMYRRTMDSNPITAAAWAATDLTSAQIALKVIS
jgi:hypothetical protein